MLPTATEVARQAEYEVDDVLDDAPIEFIERFDAPLQKLIRELMVASFERGAAYVVEAIAKG